MHWQVWFDRLFVLMSGRRATLDTDVRVHLGELAELWPEFDELLIVVCSRSGDAEA
jgi:hypothetical protein